MKIQFSSSGIRYRLTREDVKILREGELLTLSLGDIFQADVCVKNMKEECTFVREENTLSLVITPFLVEEIETNRDGVMCRCKGISINLSVDVRS